MFKLIKKAKSVNNNQIELFQTCDKTGKNILIIGGFHGDEPQGVNVLKEFIKKQITAKNTLYILPCLNPDGYLANTRVNANKVDLNRNFPTKNWEQSEKNDYFGGEKPASEPETKFLTEIISEIKPYLILSLHCPYKVVNYDGPAETFALEISKIMNYPAETDIGYPTPGSFGTYCGKEMNIPTITLELGEDEKEDWQFDRLSEVFTYLANI